ncbi:hypothetical protein CPB83DRAFT_919174 [Crepidotus variabilis]|uniref:Uncharacterized protein n=1 Tax=Crepidotus variabilis TaxID=179855 RepID=A0A9P6ELY0_9AGAR|nr:hypothetical protein CPB83DRAFT_919174 [Crepidotus variabilis]
MKFFTSTTLLFTAINAVIAATIPKHLSPTPWITAEGGFVESANSTLERRTGTEVTTCYNIGTAMDRAPAISTIDDFCTRAIGQTLKDGSSFEFRYDYGTVTALLSAQAINGCTFTIDGNCNRLLRVPLDGCNTNGENGKQGGYVTDICGQWRFDPGSNGNDF